MGRASAQVALLQPLLKGISDSHCYVTDFEFSLLLQAFQRIPAANRDSFLKSMSFFLDRDLFWFPLLATNLFDDSAGDLSALHKAIEPILEDVVPLKRDDVLALIVSVQGNRILFCKMVRPFLKDVCTNAQLDILRALQPLTPAERTRIAQLVIPLNLHPIERSLITILFSCAFPNPLADLADIEQDPRPFLIAFGSSSSPLLRNVPNQKPLRNKLPPSSVKLPYDRSPSRRSPR